MKLARLTAQQIAPYIERAAGGDLPLVLAEIDSGGAEAWRINAGTAYMVTRIERWPSGRVLVVMCYEGRALRTMAPAIIDKARAAGCVSLRYHTSRPGIKKILDGLGFVEAERVYCLGLNDGR